MKVPEGILVFGRIVIGFLIWATIAAAVMLGLFYGSGRAVALHLFLAGLTAMGFFILLVVGSAALDWLRRPNDLVALAVELGLFILGSVATLYFLFWLFVKRQPISNQRLLYVMLPEVVCAAVVLVWISTRRVGGDCIGSDQQLQSR